jgi:hypothetical protein
MANVDDPNAMREWLQRLTEQFEQLHQTVNFLTVFAVAVGLIVITMLLQAYFLRQLRLARNRARAPYFRLSWAATTAEVLRDVQILNFSMYQYWFGSVPIIGKIMTDNLPTKANELVVFVSGMAVMSLIRIWKFG